MADKRVTIGDIAEAVGLSTSTVSRALSGKGYVAADVKARVVTAAQKIGYVPDLNARNLRQGSSTQIGLVVSSILDPFYAELATGFQEVARAEGYEVILIIDRADPKEQKAAVKSLIAMGVSAIAITPVSAEAVASVRDFGRPVLQIDRSVSDANALVAGDNRAGGKMATEHLIGFGHERIALLIDHDQWTTGRARIEGWREAFTERGLAVPEDLIFKLGSSDAEIASGLDRFVGALKTKSITAIFSANSVVSQRFYVALGKHGVRVPEDVSVVAYDDALWMTMVTPTISAVSQHVEEMGRHAAELLIRQIGAGRKGPWPVRTFVQPSLIARSSVLALHNGRQSSPRL
ncbi:MAG: LacI family transcriptional regulator [Rhizobiaceae bacterium]|nr:LacI family transcriptional regulator [Rhizobiaceae bacterium]